MADQSEMKLKPGVTLDGEIEKIAKIACALKSLAVYTALACEHEDDPKELEDLVDEGLEAIDDIFDY